MEREEAEAKAKGMKEAKPAEKGKTKRGHRSPEAEKRNAENGLTGRHAVARGRKMDSSSRILK